MPIPSDQKPEGEALTANAERAEKDSKILRTLEELFTSSDFLDRLAAAKQHKRPPQTSKLSTYSYYRDIFAYQVKVSLDLMLETKHDIEWKYSDYPDLRRSSVYQRVYQGIRYLIANLDPDLRYKKLRDISVLTKEKTGVRLSFVRDKLEGREFKATTITTKDKMHEWKDQVEEFLQDTSKEILHLKVSLTTEEIADLEESFDNIHGIYPLITEKEIKIVKDKSLVVKKKED